MVLCFFFFYCYGAHQDLHSFPTRRSSDLDGRLWVSPRPALPSEVADVLYEPQESRDTTVRSEEHTSELQSRQYLVCRLLLEKKKKQQRSAPRTRTPLRTANQSTRPARMRL